MSDDEFKSFRNLKWHTQIVHLQDQATQSEVKSTEDKFSQTFQLPLSQPSDKVCKVESFKCYQNSPAVDVSTFPPCYLDKQASKN